MFYSLKYCVRTLNKSSVLIGFRKCSQFAEQAQLHFGKNGHYDIIIVGGGATGISLAGAIGKLRCNNKILYDSFKKKCFQYSAAKNPKLGEKKVLLLDGAPKFKGYSENTYSNRVYAINHNTVKLMKDIGAWDTIKSIRCRAVKQMQVYLSFFFCAIVIFFS